MPGPNTFDRKAKLLARMAAIPDAIKDPSRDKLYEQAEFLVEQIKPAVPYDQDDRDGIHLRDSVKWKPNPAPEKISVIVTEGDDDDTNGRKARALEFGRPDMDAQPHFFPTYRAWKKKINSRVLSAGRKVIRQLWGKP